MRDNGPRLAAAILGCAVNDASRCETGAQHQPDAQHIGIAFHALAACRFAAVLSALRRGVTRNTCAASCAITQASSSSETSNRSNPPSTTMVEPLASAFTLSRMVRTASPAQIDCGGTVNRNY